MRDRLHLKVYILRGSRFPAGGANALFQEFRSGPELAFKRPSNCRMWSCEFHSANVRLPLAEAEDKARGDLHIVLGVIRELGAEIVQLNQAHPDVPRGFDIDPSAKV